MRLYILCFFLQGSYYAYCHEVERNIKNLWNQEMKRNPERMEIFSTSAMPVDEKDILMRVSTNSSKSMVSGEGKDSLLLSAADRATASHRAMHSSHSKGCDTVVFPTLQMKSFNVDYDTVSQGCQRKGFFCSCPKLFNGTVTKKIYLPKLQKLLK